MKYIGRGNQAVHSKTETKQTKTFTDLNLAITMPEIIAPCKTIINGTITTNDNFESCIHDDDDTAENHNNNGSKRSKRDRTKTTKEAKRDFDEKIKNCPEAEISKKTTTIRPRHISHGKTKGNLI